MLSWMVKDEVLLAGVSGGTVEKAKARGFCCVGSRVVTPMSSSPHCVHPVHLAVTCQWVALTCVPVLRISYDAPTYAGGT